MRRHGIRALAGRRFRPTTTDSRHGLPIVPNLLQQRFVAPAPDRVWLADVTYIATGEGWLYLAAVPDLATRKIVGPPRPPRSGLLTRAPLAMGAWRMRQAWQIMAAGLSGMDRRPADRRWSMRDHLRTEVPLAALIMAVQRQRPAPGLIHHRGRGSQYAAEAYGRCLDLIGAKLSMSRTAYRYDNAPSAFGRSHGDGVDGPHAASVCQSAGCWNPLGRSRPP